VYGVPELAIEWTGSWFGGFEPPCSQQERLMGVMGFNRRRHGRGYAEKGARLADVLKVACSLAAQQLSGSQPRHKQGRGRR
jgi:hypothetical protein